MKFSWFHLVFCLGFFTQLVHADQEQGTWHQHRFRNMVEQKLDISCGAASMSALITYYARIPIGEAALLKLLERLVPETEQDDVLLDGFSLLHLKKAVASIGLELKAADIYNDQLVRFESPALLQLKTTQGHHFVLWHGKVKGRHWLGDPSRGDLWLSDRELEQEWTGIAAWLFQSGRPLAQASREQLEVVYAKR